MQSAPIFEISNYGLRRVQTCPLMGKGGYSRAGVNLDNKQGVDHRPVCVNMFVGFQMHY